MAQSLRPTSFRNLARLIAPRSVRHHSSSSVSQAELSHFATLASSWWDPHGSSRLLHLMNPVRHRFIASCLTASPPTSTREDSDTAEDQRGTLRYLDIGCGGGIFAESAARLATTMHVTAIDPSPEIIHVAKAHARQDPGLTASRLGYLNTSIEHLPPPESPAQGYDVVTLFEVIEHVSNPSAFLSRCLQHVKPGGWIIGSTIARSWTSWLTTKVVAEDIVGIVPRGTHDWDKYINADELVQWFQGQKGWQRGGRVLGVLYVPGLGWKEVEGGEEWGNYFWGFRRTIESED